MSYSLQMKSFQNDWVSDSSIILTNVGDPKIHLPVATNQKSDVGDGLLLGFYHMANGRKQYGGFVRNGTTRKPSEPSYM